MWSRSAHSSIPPETTVKLFPGGSVMTRGTSGTAPSMDRNTDEEARRADAVNDGVRPLIGNTISPHRRFSIRLSAHRQQTDINTQ